MSRRLLISIHLYLSAFFAPMIIIMAVSGGLYLIGEKGSTEERHIATFDGRVIDFNTSDAPEQVRALLQELNLDSDFEYLKVRGKNADTRPTSRRYVSLRQHQGALEVVEMTPSLQAALMELHKGHGPKAYKLLEQVFALGLLLIILSGLYLGLTSKMLRNKTIGLAGLGLLVFIALAYLL